MRSRYAAFVLLDDSYLMRTWHRRTRPPSVAFDPKLKWLGLRIVQAQSLGTDAGAVEFIARFRVGGATARRHHELSTFEREEGAWFYVDGELVESASRSPARR